jgi:alpha-N-arabinofuranosidase
MRKMNAQMVDEHYYKTPDWFLQNAARYDSYDRSGPKVFAGEYAAHDKEGKDAESRNTWKSALAEAAFMTGLERNADVVQMASYAPLFGNVNAWQWRPDLIWFDNLRSVATANYYVQKMFSTNNGTDVVIAQVNGKPLTGQDSLYASASIDAKRSELIVKIVNVSKTVANFSVVIEGRQPASKEAKLQVLSNSDLGAYNTLERPQVVVPVEKKVNLSGKKLALNSEGQSFTVVRVPLKK